MCVGPWQLTHVNALFVLSQIVNRLTWKAKLKDALEMSRDEEDDSDTVSNIVKWFNENKDNKNVTGKQFQVSNTASSGKYT